MFMHISCIRYFFSFHLFVSGCDMFFLSPFLSFSESSWFRVYFFWSYLSSPDLIPWWEGPKGLLRELSKTWRSSWAPCYSVRFFWHSSPCSRSDSGLGISTWESFEVSYHVYTGVLLQYTQYWYLCTSVCHYNSRYTYRSYPKSYTWGTTCSMSSTFWLPWLWAF